MRMVEYRKISLKKELCDEVEEFIREHPEFGYRSIAEFVEDAIRRRAEELGILTSTRRAAAEQLPQDRLPA